MGEGSSVATLRFPNVRGLGVVFGKQLLDDFIDY